MSTFFLADRIKELSRTEDQNAIVLDGAAPGFSSFADFFASGDVVFYAITDNVDYEVGSGVYSPNGADRTITRFPFRSSTLNSGPYYVNGDEADGPAGYYYPVYLTRSAAISGVGFTDGPYTNVSELEFDEFPGVTFYRPSEHQGYSTLVSDATASGSDYNTLSQPVDFDTGVKEVFVTYPGKTAVFNGYGLDPSIREPKTSGIAFWQNEQLINYSSQIVWDDSNGRIGINQPNPQYAVDVGGLTADSIVRASGFIEGGSGIAFSGGQLTYTSQTASGGLQLEPFLRNQLGTAAVGVIDLSGIVDQFIGLAPQSPGTVFAGPLVDYCGVGCVDPDYPTFRNLTVDDLPVNDLAADAGFVIQNNLGLDSETANISPNNYVIGMIPIYSASGEIAYDSGILFDPNANRLLVGGDASSDTASYTVDARGSIGSQSGYLNQLIFTDDLIRIGDFSGTDDGNSTNNYFTIGIGNYAAATTSVIFDGLFVGRFAGLTAEASSGVVAVGLRAAQSMSGVVNSVGIGGNALRSSDELTSGVAIGENAGYSLIDSNRFDIVGVGAAQGSSGIDFSSIIGTNAAQTASGVNYSVLIGADVALSSSGLNNVVAVGNLSLNGSTDLQSVVSIGELAGSGSVESTNAVWIGLNAGGDSPSLVNTVGIGTNAAYQASGNANVFVGVNAGIKASGSRNIEIVTSGQDPVSWIGSTANNKINIDRTFVADSSSGKTSVGNPSGIDPIATLTVEPKSADDAAFIVRHEGSGSATPYVMMQSGDGTTFYHISNSGDVVTSGCMNPSGGLLLEPLAVPLDWMNSTDNRLYNEGGTLKYNGSTITVGGAYSWYLTDGIVTPDEITDEQEVIISGVSGVDINYQASTNRLIVDAGELSGVLQAQISASDFEFGVVSSGVEFGNNVVKTMNTESVVVLSGINGIEIGFIDLDDGTNSSGVFEISYDPTASYSFSATNGDVADQVISNGDTISISGVSGVNVNFEYTAEGSGLFQVGANELSGVLRDDIDANLDFLSNEFGGISVSGVSGVAFYASGQIDGFTTASATSGLIYENNKYIMDPAGSGTLRFLNFSNGSVTIGAEESPEIDRAIWTPGQGSVIIGSGAGQAALGTNDVDVIAIGARALAGNVQADHDGTIAIGRDAHKESIQQSTTQYNIALGYSSLNIPSGSYNIGIGYRAGGQSSITIGGTGGRPGRWTNSNIAIGEQAGRFQDAAIDGYDISIGYKAGYESIFGGRNIAMGISALASTSTLIGGATSGCYDTISIGRSSSQNGRDLVGCTNVGYFASHKASGIGRGVCIGYGAGYGIKPSTLGDQQGSPIAIGTQAASGSIDCEQMIAIGDNAAVATDGAEHSVFIGRGAGYLREGKNSIILSNRSALPAGGSYDANWSSINDEILDVASIIQGRTDLNNVHIGLPLLEATAPDYRTSNLTSSALSVSPAGKNRNGIVINRHTNTSVPYNSNDDQQSPLLAVKALSGRNYGTSTPSESSTNNIIVNADGFLRLPVAYSKTGTYPNTQLLGPSPLQEVIEPGEGVICIYEFSDTDKGIAFCTDENGRQVWNKIPFSALM